MAYCTEADVSNAIAGDARLKQLSDFAGDNAIDSTAVAEAIAEASSFFDGYARTQTSTPIPDAQVPDVVRRKIAREALYQLAMSRGQIPAFLEKQHTEHLLWLEDISRHRFKLVLKDEEPAAAETAETGELGEVGEFDSPDLGGLW